MARVTDAEVKEIMATSIDTTPFIEVANLEVTEKLGDSSLSTDRLKQIEKFLAAHLSCMKDPRVSNKKIGDASKSYSGVGGGLSLNATSYGQTVKMLDTTGILERNDGKKSASFESLNWD